MHVLGINSNSFSSIFVTEVTMSEPHRNMFYRVNYRRFSSNRNIIYEKITDTNN